MMDDLQTDLKFINNINKPGRTKIACNTYHHPYKIQLAKENQSSIYPAHFYSYKYQLQNMKLFIWLHTHPNHLTSCAPNPSTRLFSLISANIKRRDQPKEEKAPLSEHKLTTGQVQVFPWGAWPLGHSVELYRKSSSLRFHDWTGCTCPWG